ncbi:MAG: YkgJ family cysteine cluster protein [Bacteroidetes bacterium]|nr:YkgJ family cysteine cluster protein [Bacteroidota bacterium]
MKWTIEAFKEASAARMADTKNYFKKLIKKTPKNLDLIMQDLHEEVFDYTNCLQCANCCKTTSPIFTTKDIAKISKHLRIKEIQFINQYLRIDEDNFYVLQTAPCSFLMADNECMIYDVRPKACSEYPHTDRKKFIQIASLTLKNTEVCPAVLDIVEKLKQKVPFN